jgi:peptidoglycan biosynthesis protein MviN/MurJ (putative lipid II flippase)
VILTHFGAGRQTDSYFAALAVPVVVLYVLSDPLNRVALPSLSVHTGEEFWEHAWTTIEITVFIFLGVAGLLYLTAPRWVSLLVPGFSADAASKTVELTRLLLAGMVLQSGSMAARSVWNARGYFVWPTTAGLLSAIAALALLLVTVRTHGIESAAWAFNLRFATECLLLTGTLGTFRRPHWRLAVPFLRKSRPLMLGAAYFRTDVIVDRVLTSLAPPGGLSLLYLAQQLLSAIGQVLNQSVVAPTIPLLAKIAHAGDWPAFGRTARISTRNLLGISLLILFALVAFGGPALSLVFAHRSLNSSDINRLLLLMLALGGMLAADSLGYFAYSSFYAIGDTSTPTIATAFVYSIGVAIKIGAFLLTGVVGLALGISLYYVANALILLYLLRRRLLSLRRAMPESTQPVTPEGPFASSTTVETF